MSRSSSFADQEDQARRSDVGKGIREGVDRVLSKYMEVDPIYMVGIGSIFVYIIYTYSTEYVFFIQTSSYDLSFV